MELCDEFADGCVLLSAFQFLVRFELSIGRMSEDSLMVFVDGHDVFLQQPVETLVAACASYADRIEGAGGLESLDCVSGVRGVCK